MPGLLNLLGLFCILAAPVLIGLAAYLDLRTLRIRALHGPAARLETSSNYRRGFEVTVDVSRRQAPGFAAIVTRETRGFEVKPITGLPPVAEKEADDHG